MLHKKRAFASPSVLTDETVVLGATAMQWDHALTGNFQQTLDNIKARINLNRTETTKASVRPEQER
jgi:hypothetical protein